ncbi:MAG: LCP family protein [Clostridia bacterium]|nr:LCP family protein [Clostridia bacterium]
MKKKKKGNMALRSLKITLVSLILIFAAVSGVYCAKLYTTPNSNIVEYFAPGTLEEVEISKEKCNILILGTDKEGLRTDVMMLAQIDPERGTSTVMSIPRDTLVKYNGRNRKITEVHSVGMRKGKQYGTEAAIIATKDLTGIPIHHFVKVNLKAFNDCIDELGGVEFNVPRNMYYVDPAQDLYINLKKGKQILDGNRAEQLIRYRKGYAQGDLARIKVQQDFIHALVEQKLQLKYIGRIDDIYSILADNMETSMSPDDMVQCSRELLDIGTDKMTTITMPGNPKTIGGGSYVVVEQEEFLNVREQSFGYDRSGNEIKK